MWDAVGTGWQLVRRVAPGTAWHPAKDRLNGTKAYGEWPSSTAQTADATFSTSFSGENFTQFLFASGDEQVWLVCTKEAAVGSYYEGPRPVLMSSDTLSPYSAFWLNREAGTSGRPGYPYSEDPWISVTDHDVARAGNKIVYGENGYNSAVHTAVLSIHNGANVWIRHGDYSAASATKTSGADSLDCGFIPTFPESL